MAGVHAATARRRGHCVFNTATVVKQVQTLSQLVTVKYVMEKIVVREGREVVSAATTGSAIIAHGIVKAGGFPKMKPEDLQCWRRRKGETRLPNLQITDCYLDEKQTQIYERTTGLLRSFDKDLEQTARQIAVDDIRRGAHGGILKDAEERARAQVEKLFLQLGLKWIPAPVSHRGARSIPAQQKTTALWKPSIRTGRRNTGVTLKSDQPTTAGIAARSGFTWLILMVIGAGMAAVYRHAAAGCWFARLGNAIA